MAHWPQDLVPITGPRRGTHPGSEVLGLFLLARKSSNATEPEEQKQLHGSIHPNPQAAPLWMGL